VVSLNRDLCLFITGCRQLLLFSTSLINPLVTMPVIATLLLRIKLDQCVNAHDRHTRLDGGLQLFNLAHAGLEDTGLQAIVHLAVCEVQPVVLVVLRLGKLLRVLRRRVGGVDGSLRERVSRSQVGNELGCVLCCVDGEGLRNGKESLCKGCDRQLLTRALCDMSVYTLKTRVRKYLRLMLPILPSRCAEQSQQHLHRAQYVRSREFA
jgi:hypothetical protein